MNNLSQIALPAHISKDIFDNVSHLEKCKEFHWNGALGSPLMEKETF